MNRIGLSVCGKEMNEALFAAYRDAGIRAMEISAAHGKHGTLDYAAIGTLAKQYGIELWSYHLPFSQEQDDCSLPIFFEGSYDYFCSLMTRAAAIGVQVFVVHPSREPITEEREARMAQAKKSLAALAEFANTLGVTLAVEDLPRTCLGRNSAEMLELLDAHPDLRVCFDTNHLLGEDPVDFIRAVGDKIVTLHVSDYDLIDERHWLPGEGKTDWQALLGALREVGYCGPWLYEISFAAPKTMPRSRTLCCADFVRNANELFAGSVPTRIE